MATAVGVVAFGVGTADGYVMQPRAAAPSLKFTTRPAAVSAVARPKVAWTATIIAKTTGCTLDGRAIKECHSGLTLPALTSGSHSFKVTVTSAAGKKVLGQLQWLTDLVAPSVPTVTGAPAGWVNSPVTLTASDATDRGSGVAKYQHRSHVDGGAWGAVAVGQQLTVSASGCAWAEFRAVDGAGNLSVWTAPARVCIDTTAPALSPSGGSASWRAGPVTISAGASDSQSGVAGVLYETSIDGGASWSEPAPGAAAVVSREGTTLVRFQATDAAGNATGWTVPAAGATVRIDDTAPTLAPGGGSDTWSLTSVTIAAGAADGGSGVASVVHETSRDGGLTWSQPQTGGSVVIASIRTTLVRFQATDAAGNTSAWTVPDGGTTAMIDGGPPDLTFSGGSTSWVTGPVTISAAATETVSGIASVEYKTSADSGHTWSAPQLGTSVTITSEGTTEAAFQAIDNAGNSSGWTVSPGVAKIDTTAPTVVVQGGSSAWAKQPVTISASVSDAGVGGGSVVYETSPNGGLTWTGPAIGSSVTVSAQGTTLVRFRATDALGHASIWTVPDEDSTVMIDSTPPTITAPIGGSTSWSQGPETISVQASDANSGLAGVTYEVSTDQGLTWGSPRSGSSVAFSANGESDVRFEATDNAGNSTAWVRDDASWVLIDTTPPSITVNDLGAAWTRIPSVSASVSDFGSGVASVLSETSVDGGQTWSTPVGGTTVTHFPEGVSEVRFEATDNVGNISSWTTPALVQNDTTSPTLAVGGGSQSWSAAPVTIAASASDAGSGVQFVQHETSSDGGQTWSAPSTGQSVTVTSGKILVRFQAFDYAGNSSGWSVPDAAATAMVDGLPPVVSISGGGKTWTSGPVTVTANVSDVWSGVAAVYYETSTDGGNTWSATQIGNVATITADGITEVRFQAVDNLGNTTPWILAAAGWAQIDTTPPSVTVQDPTPTWTRWASVSATVNDGNGSGPGTIVHETSTDGGATWSSPIAGSSVSSFPDGVSEVRFDATDQVGLSSGWTAPATVEEDATPPMVTLSGWDPVAGQEPVPISANATDALSGVQQVWYRTWDPVTDFWSAKTVGSSAEIDTTVTLVQFQAEDYAGNLSPWVQADTFSQLIDTLPPTMSPSGGWSTWLAGPVTISANAQDDISGVATVVNEVSTDGGVTWSSPALGATVTLMSSALVRFQATDNVGNTSAWVGPTAATTALVDSTPPTISPSGGSSWTRGPVIIAANASDGLSGMGNVFYETSRDGGATWSGSQGASSVTVSAPGITEVRFRAYDVVGNLSAWSVPSAASTAMIDMTPPTVSPSGGSLSTASGPVTIIAGAADDTSGVATVQYELSIDGGATWSTPDPGTSVIVSREGTTLVRFRATDAAGNTSSWSVPGAGSTVVMHDPLTLSPSGGNGSGAWSLGPITVSAGEEDSASANVSVRYQTSDDDGAAWSTPQAGDSVLVSANGTTLVRFEATDGAGNLATWTIPTSNSTVLIDTNSPTLSPSGGGTPSAVPVVVQAGATDSESGVASVSYETSTDGGQSWSSPQTGASVTITDEGSTLVRFQATDNLGNTNDWSDPTSASTALIEQPVDIMLVVDRSGSTAGAVFTNEKSALLQGFLAGLSPALDNVGLTLFPPDKYGTTDVCSQQFVSSYDVAQPLYTVVPLGNSYMTGSGSLITTSPLVSDITCLKPGGGTDFANALESADSELLADGRPGVHKAIILLSDGGANTGQNCPARNQDGTWPVGTDSHCTNPCATAVADGATYQAAGIAVYAVQMTPNGAGDYCETPDGALEQPGISPKAALTAIASPGNYFAAGDPTTLGTVLRGMITGVTVP